MAEDAIEDLKIAVGEACANAVISAPEDAPTDRVTVTWSDEPKRIVIEVGEPEHGGEPSVEWPEAVDSGGFSTRAVMSTALLQSLVDECEVVHSSRGVVYTRLVVNLSGT